MKLDPSSKRARLGAKIKLILLTFLLVSVTATTILFLYTSGGDEVGDYILAAPILLVILLMIPILLRFRESAKLGLPVEDERSRAVADRAGAVTFYVSLYVWLGISMFGEGKLDLGQASGLAIMVSALLYLVLRVSLQRREMK